MIINNFSYSKYTYNTTAFTGRGKPISLDYVLKNREKYLPHSVLNSVKVAVAKGKEKTLLEIHKSIYAPLMESDMTIEKLKQIFPEFASLNTSYRFEKNCKSLRAIGNQSMDEFLLKMFRELWYELKNKDDVAHDIGLKSRGTLDWVLQQTKFPAPSSRYKTLLRASDPEMNKEIARKTTAWNALHPDLMYARNKHAAQFCKTEEYKKAQSERIKELDMKNPKRRMDITAFNKEMWNTAEGMAVRDSMSDYASELPDSRGSFKTFWPDNIEMKSILSQAAEEVRLKRKPKK